MFGIFSAFTNLIGIAVNASSQAQQRKLQEQQLELQKKQFELEQQKYYDDMQSNYYSLMQDLQDMKGEQESALVSKNQAYEDIASNQLYLDRWQSEYDSSMNNAISESYALYDQQRAALGMTDVNAAESGRIGGSVGLISGTQKRNLTDLTGGTLSFSLKDNLLSNYLNATAQDLLAERQTASSAIRTGYDSIASYQEAIRLMQENIDSMTNTSEEMKKVLIENGRTV